MNGLKVLCEVAEAMFPKTQVPLCTVHRVRHSLSFMNWKEYKCAADLDASYSAPTEEQAEGAMNALGEKYDAR